MKFNIFKNFHLKLLAFFLAVLLWLFVASQKSLKNTYSVPVKYMNLPANMKIMNIEPDMVQLTVEGIKDLIKNNKLHNLHITLNLKSAVNGINNIKIERKQVSLPSGVRVFSIEPDVIKVTLSERIEKKIKVEPLIVGEPDEDYDISSIKVLPSVILVEGTEESLKKLEFLSTFPIDVKGKKDSFEYEIKIKSPEKVNILGVNKVKVKITIKEKEIEKKLSDIPLKIVGEYKDKNVELYPDKVTILLKGPKNRIKNLISNSIYGSLTLKKDEENIAPEFNLPEGIRVMLISPPKVKTVIKEK